MSSVTEIALTESRALRSQYADQVDVLDKVKALDLLPDGLHVTAEMVAQYYEVSVETIRKLIQRNRDELTENGMSVLAGQGLRDIVSISSLPRSTPRLTIFSRRTVLNVGELLRDSEVAREVRTLLLDAEENERAVDVHRPHSLPEALRAYADELEAHERTKAALAEARPLAEAYRDLMSKDGTFDWAAVAQIFGQLTGGLGRNRFLELLRELGVLKTNNTPYQRYVHYFKVVGDTGGSSAVPTTTVRPKGLDWLRLRLLSHFYQQGSLFLVGRTAS